ncbi:MAG: RidA family protein [Acidobacteria bacterium]|nr:RidA family protein [Acidobacteriota bacterium]
MAQHPHLKLVNPESLMPPIGFAHACVARGSRIVFLAGQVSSDKEGNILHRNDLVKQFDLALENMRICIEEAGGTMDQITKLTYYVINVADYLAKRKELGVVYRKYFGRHFPAMTLVGVTGLYNDGALIEIDGFAVLE